MVYPTRAGGDGNCRAWELQRLPGSTGGWSGVTGTRRQSCQKEKGCCWAWLGRVRGGRGGGSSACSACSQVLSGVAELINESSSVWAKQENFQVVGKMNTDLGVDPRCLGTVIFQG